MKHTLAVICALVMAQAVPAIPQSEAERGKAQKNEAQKNEARKDEARKSEVRNSADDDAPKKLRIGVLYPSSGTGVSHLAGVRRAVSESDLANVIQLVPHAYFNEDEGVRKLVEWIKGPDAADPTEAPTAEQSTEATTGQVSTDPTDAATSSPSSATIHLVLGPTDSGVFVTAREREETFGDDNIPVISAQVVAAVPNRPDGWFFRTNVDVTRRVGSMFDHFNKRWVNSFAVLYADTEFGRRAESTLRSLLTGSQVDNYVASAYRVPRVRQEIGAVLDKLPAVIGIFGNREDIPLIHQGIQSMNPSGTPYRPLLFTLTDVSETSRGIDDIHFASVMSPSQDRSIAGEVAALSYDTTRIVLEEIGHLVGQGEKADVGKYDKFAFRKRFVNILQGGGSWAPTDTNMRFSNMENCSPIGIYRVKNNAFVEESTASVSLLDKLEFKQELLERRFGNWPYIIALIMILTIGATAAQDLYRWYGGRFFKLVVGWYRIPRLPFAIPFVSFYFLILVAVQGAVALTLFGYAAETGAMRYDSVVNALIVSMAPSPLLRANFARALGVKIGVGEHYDRMLKWLTKRLLQVRYRDIETNIMVISYYNTLSFLDKTLNKIYDSLQNQSEAGRLRAEKDEEIKTAATRLEKRRAIAKRLVELRTWEELYNMDCVPENMKDVALNPHELITEVVNFAQHDESRKWKLAEVEAKYLEKAPDRIREHNLTKHKDEAEDDRDHMVIAIQFLIMRFRFGREQFVREGVIPSLKGLAYYNRLEALEKVLTDEVARLESRGRPEDRKRSKSIKKQMKAILSEQSAAGTDDAGSGEGSSEGAPSSPLRAARLETRKKLAELLREVTTWNEIQAAGLELGDMEDPEVMIRECLNRSYNHDARTKKIEEELARQREGASELIGKEIDAMLLPEAAETSKEQLAAKIQILIGFFHYTRDHFVKLRILEKQDEAAESRQWYYERVAGLGARVVDSGTAEADAGRGAPVGADSSGGDPSGVGRDGATSKKRARSRRARDGEPSAADSNGAAPAGQADTRPGPARKAAAAKIPQPEKDRPSAETPESPAAAPSSADGA